MHYYKKLFDLFKVTLPFMVMFVVIFLVHFANIVAFKFYPPIVNFGFFVIFFTSIFQKYTVIQKFVLKTEPNINTHILSYTRKLTYVWAGVTFFNFTISLITVFLPKFYWIIYNGIISYVLIGLVFIIEYFIRINFKRKYGQKV